MHGADRRRVSHVRCTLRERRRVGLGKVGRYQAGVGERGTEGLVDWVSGEMGG